LVAASVAALLAFRAPSAPDDPGGSAQAAPPKPAPPDDQPVLVRDDKPPQAVARPAEPPDLHAAPFDGQFLGSTARGRRFCIIADNSGSMGRNIPELKAQLLKTLAGLDKDGEFYLYCFNTRPEPMPHPGWMKAGAAEAAKVRDWIGSIKARGGTRPTPAFEAAFKLSPPPDVVFFMTDGLIPRDVPDRVAALNTGTPKAVVNTILFANAPTGGKGAKGNNRAEDSLKRIAEQSGGTFTRYVPQG
ncbi:MAG: hypothetical protein K2W96_13615, partial [Gemmataceae bacterium]|nr:hypothetical protein [Gemmataceae bacterium]